MPKTLAFQTRCGTDIGHRVILTSEKFSSSVSEPFPNANDWVADGKVAATVVGGIASGVTMGTGFVTVSVKVEGKTVGGDIGAGGNGVAVS